MSGPSNNRLQDIYRQNLGGLDAWTRHQRLIDSYVKHRQKSGTEFPEETPAKTELDILHENHRFLRSEEDDRDLTWEQRIAKKYYDKLFKEYALVELKYYTEGRIAMRWRTEKEVFSGKGQFTCGSLRCDESKGLQSWEVNFGYVEHGEKKNALVKIRLCDKCSYRLNYKTAQKRVASSSATTRQEREKSRSSIRRGSGVWDGSKTRDYRGSRLEEAHSRHGENTRSAEKALNRTKESFEESKHTRHAKDRQRRSRRDEQIEEDEQDEQDIDRKDRDGRSSSDKSVRKERKGRSDEFDAVFHGLFE
ncbi:hypothetical protein BGZ70_004250 [Mortierella alpina]|uniref:Protein FRA10AC1 n=1 Tax=Mortierella alpina TaxID=64518 RepID=A0A9P6IRI5_MORAP|nr:hypothetical protein BGZ70_004250 [Mortierella alpina]